MNKYRKYQVGEKAPNWKGGEIELICLFCKGKFLVRRCRKDTAKFCSRSCLAKFHTEESSFNWHGDKVSCEGIHRWVFKWLGKHPKLCEHCGVLGKINGTEGKKHSLRWSIHWANKSGGYKRVLSDWIPLCVSCHRKFDGTEPWRYSKGGLAI